MTLTISDAFARAAPGIPEAQPASRLPARAGVGLKPQYFATLLATDPDLGFFEIHAENYPAAPFTIRARWVGGSCRSVAAGRRPAGDRLRAWNTARCGGRLGAGRPS